MAATVSRTASDLRAPFEAATPYAVGLEDEVMLLDPETLALVHRAPEVLAMVEGDPRIKLELPASQLEIVTAPAATVAEVRAELLDARRTLAAAAAGQVVFAAAGAHPFSSGVGILNHGPRYSAITREYGCLARRELVCALQVHVSVRDSERALSVYNAARSYLPYLAALAAGAPLYEGADTGLASVRPKLAGLLPRQGVPPAIESWEHYAEILAWGASSGAFSDPARWWWELRLHPGFGTLEFRVPDGQSTVADAGAVAAVTQALVAWLGARHDAGERIAPDPSWRIEENRWSACRDGVQGEMADLLTGGRRRTRACVLELLDVLEPFACELGSSGELDHARGLAEVNGAMAQRGVAGCGGARAVARWLSERFLDEPGG
jgi:carboxylate-amine ligase